MKKILYGGGVLTILAMVFLNSRATSHISAVESTNATYSNRTVKELVKLSETDKDLLSMLAKYPDETPIIECGGGFFVNENETKETYKVEMRSEDGEKILFSDANPATVGEVKKAILENQ
ncbi:Uncharacterised protein [Chlamydia trachomatis]|nr:Uncharacterised protein [Chlamydia trachomatis]